MSNLLEKLIDNALEDKELLASNNDLGDISSIGRNVEFRFIATNKASSDLACKVISNLKYGVPKVAKSGSVYEIRVTVHMPLTAEVVNCVSGFMACLGELFALEYDGWEADIVKG